MSDPFDSEAFRLAGHQVIDRLADYLRDARNRAVGPVLPAGSPEQVLALFAEPPRDLSHLVERVLTNSTHFHHPGNLGHQVAPPLPEAVLCDLLASMMNNSSAVFETSPAGVVIEHHVIDQLAESFGFASGVASGLIVSGGSIGNLTALLAARRAFLDRTPKGSSPGPLAILVSEQAHYCVARAAQIMGLGEEGVYRVPVDERFRMNTAALASVHARAKADGRTPFVVVGSAGTTATGSMDPLHAIADFAVQEQLWFHVDGAHGAALAFHPRLKAKVAGLERADSLVWDAHKLALMPSLLTAVVFKNGDHPYATFSQTAHYLYAQAKPARDRWFDAGPRTIECTKPMAALKLYALLSFRGAAWIGDYVATMCERAERFAKRLQEEARCELATVPECNIVCFRPIGMSDEQVDDLRLRVNKEGAFYIVRTTLNGRTYLRSTLLNPLTTDADLAGLVTRIASR